MCDDTEALQEEIGAGGSYPWEFSDINSDVSARYKSPNDAQSFLPLEGVTFHSVSNESISDAGIFSGETENEIINKSISCQIQRRQMQKDVFKHSKRISKCHIEIFKLRSVVRHYWWHINDRNFCATSKLVASQKHILI